MIEEFTWDGSNAVQWKLNDGSVAKKEWKHAPKSVVRLADRRVLMVIEAGAESGYTNLVILNADGSERMRPKPPTDFGSTHGFDGGYESDRLVVVIAIVGGDLAFEFDPTTGLFSKGTRRM